MYRWSDVLPGCSLDHSQIMQENLIIGFLTNLGNRSGKKGVQQLAQNGTFFIHFPIQLFRKCNANM